MYKLYSIAAAGLALAGCAAAPPDTPALAPAAYSAASEDAQASTIPAKSLNMADFKGEGMRCEELTRPGSRIVVARRCQSIDEAALEDTLNQVRRDQDTLDRLARERENQRRGGP
jgi:hypothetical protein